MKRKMIVALISMLVLGATARGEDAAPAQEVAKSLQQLSTEVQALLTKEKIHSLFDQYRKLSDFGVTYQPSLAALNDLVPEMDNERLRLYAGMKLFDAIYAVTFMKKQEVADCVKTLEEIQTALDLRSYADLNNRCLETLKRAATDPEALDVKQLIDQLTDDYVSEVPALMSSQESADYLIDGFYGFVTEMSYVMSGLLRSDASGRIEEGLDQLEGPNNRRMILDLFVAFDREDEQMEVSGMTVEKLAVIRQGCYLAEAEMSGKLSDEDAQQERMAMSTQVAFIRSGILMTEVE
ncbi:MAG TPA: hypothetical protein DCZ95_03575 [Verrucomicrobia bacterium]|nr:MAG: hypothetical protein A2X46_01390 [Lentisphaerae bacterium GWF2_57_35]HBA83154.1 hypothetical protein [Verrucomicrobiota bacterium]